MVSRGATSLLGALEGVGPENLDFFDLDVPRHKNNRYNNSYLGKNTCRVPPPAPKKKN
jgi:hypothetical protein